MVFETLPHLISTVWHESVIRVHSYTAHKMNQMKTLHTITVLLPNVTLNYQATNVPCGRAGTFMYPSYMRDAGPSRRYTPCGWCDQAAGKWSDPFTPTQQGTDCGCNSGRYFAAGVDASFTCPRCPFGTYTNGVSRVEACTSISEGSSPQTLVTPSGNAGPDSLVYSPVRAQTPESGTPNIATGNGTPTWITTSTICGIIVVMVATIALIWYMKPTCTSRSAQAGISQTVPVSAHADVADIVTQSTLPNSNSTLHDTIISMPGVANYRP